MTKRVLGKMSGNKNGFERRNIEPNNTIFEEGQPGTAAFLIVSGKVEVRVGMKGESPRTLSKLGKGDILGEMALFDNQPRMASAVAIEKTEVIRISRDEFRARMEDMDPVMRSILLMMVKRMREMSDQMAEMKRTDWRPAGV